MLGGSSLKLQSLRFSEVSDCSRPRLDGSSLKLLQCFRFSEVSDCSSPRLGGSSTKLRQPPRYSEVSDRSRPRLGGSTVRMSLLLITRDSQATTSRPFTSRATSSFDASGLTVASRMGLPSWIAAKYCRTVLAATRAVREFFASRLSLRQSHFFRSSLVSDCSSTSLRQPARSSEVSDCSSPRLGGSSLKLRHSLRFSEVSDCSSPRLGGSSTKLLQPFRFSSVSDCSSPRL